MSDGLINHIWLTLHRVEDHLESRATWEAQQLYRTLHGYKSRVDRLQSAFRDSGPMASHMIAVKLEGLDLTMIWRILMSALHDVALYYCGSVVAGTAIGAGAGAMAGGVGAIPGAGIGMAAGMQLGTWVMAFLGLKMFAEGLAEIIPQAFRWYADGFHAVWGPATQNRSDARYTMSAANSEITAAHCFAQGHVLMIVGMLTAFVAYLTHGESEEVLLQAVRSSQRLGPKMADWVAKNKEILKKHPALQPKVRQPPERNHLSDQDTNSSSRPRRQPTRETNADNNVAQNAPPKRPSWRQSEQDAGKRLGDGYEEQKSFKDGKEVPYGTKGSTRPDWYKDGSSVEVKNYNIETSAGQERLIDNVSKQAIYRAQQLPSNTVQSLFVDVRGQAVSRGELQNVIQAITTRSNGIIQPGNITILR
ncbi:Uncharacterised protein [Burkholderia pseudomallei]|nr:Uncharacterised protein [Burkholderia pseudomallei]